MKTYIEKNHYKAIKINDCHWHISRQYPIEETREYIKKEMDYLNLDKIVALSYIHDSGLEIDDTANIKALYLRDTGENRVFAFAALRYYNDERDNADEFLRQVKLYHEIGFDGIKMLEGKPSYHSRFNCKIDGEKYEKMFDYIAENDIPLLIHVADFFPHITKEQIEENNKIHGEFLNVLKKHPNMRVTLAHAFNMTNDLEKLTEVMDTYKNVSIDLALGGDILINFSNNIEKWREFYKKYSDRIIYGSDTYNMYFDENDDYEITGRHTPLHEFFESDKPFHVDYYDRFPSYYGENVVLTPLGLPEDIVKNVYYNSFIKAFGDKPKTTNKALALKYCDELIKGYKGGTLETRAFTELPDWISDVEKANMARGNELALENLDIIKKFYSK